MSVDDSIFVTAESHRAWLTKHENITAEWLGGAIAEGFQIHHIDCNHENNSPDNLLLIFGRDHMYIHGLNSNFARMANKSRNEWICKRKNMYERIKVGEKGYELRQSGMKWREVAETLGYTDGNIAITASNATRQYAKYNKLEWPITI